MNVRENCLYETGESGCPIGCLQCDGCPWDRVEAERRKKLPLIRDDKTGLLRIVIGRKQQSEED
mgnify:CR=1 FL=1